MRRPGLAPPCELGYETRGKSVVPASASGTILVKIKGAGPKRRTTHVDPNVPSGTVSTLRQMDAFVVFRAGDGEHKLRINDSSALKVAREMNLSDADFVQFELGDDDLVWINRTNVLYIRDAGTPELGSL